MIDAATEPLFPSRWPPQHPDRIQLYSLATPNGQKIAIALEELELPYEAHRLDILEGDQFDPEYLKLNPNGKIPTIVDPDGPGGRPICLMESGAILQYLADKAGRLVPRDARLRWEVTQWLFFQVANVGPYFGQFGHFFKYARDKTSDEYALERYTAETRRLLGVLDRRLEGRKYLVGSEISIADIATFPWVRGLDHYGGQGAVGYDTFPNVDPWVKRCAARPAAQRGAEVCPFD